MKYINALLFFILISYSIHAADPKITEIIAHSGDAKTYPGKSELVLFDSTIVDVQESGLSYVTMHKLIKILNAEGAKNNAVVKMGYDPLSAYVEIRKVIVYKKSGEVKELDLGNVKDYPAPARMIYWGARGKNDRCRPVGTRRCG